MYRNAPYSIDETEIERTGPANGICPTNKPTTSALRRLLDTAARSTTIIDTNQLSVDSNTSQVAAEYDEHDEPV